LENTISYILRSLAMKYRYYVHNVLGKDKHGATQDLAIYHISEHMGLSQKDLVDKLGIKPASVSSIVNQMESEGLLIRVQDEKDARKFKLLLTDKGQSLVPDVIRSWQKIQDEVTKGFTDEEKALLIRLLKQMDQNLQGLMH
jgi:DNA-binding MarR family transcriptional regulator